MIVCEEKGEGDPAGKLSCCDWLDWWRVFSPFQVDETPERAAWIVMIRYTKYHVPANAEHYKIEILNTLFYPLLAWSDRFFHASRFRWSSFFFSKGLLCHLPLFFKSIRFRFSNLLFSLCLLSPNCRIADFFNLLFTCKLTSVLPTNTLLSLALSRLALHRRSLNLTRHTRNRIKRIWSGSYWRLEKRRLEVGSRFTYM